MNRFAVKDGCEPEFEKRWAQRESKLQEAQPDSDSKHVKDLRFKSGSLPSALRGLCAVLHPQAEGFKFFQLLRRDQVPDDDVFWMDDRRGCLQACCT